MFSLNCKLPKINSDIFHIFVVPGVEVKVIINDKRDINSK